MAPTNTMRPSSSARRRQGGGGSFTTTTFTKFLLIIASVIGIWLIAITKFLHKNLQLQKGIATHNKEGETIFVHSSGRKRAKERLHNPEGATNGGRRHKWELTPSDDLALGFGPNDTDLHIVFSTDCSPYQHWQSYQLFLSALKIRQPGRITRIASGCTEEEETNIKKWFDEHIAILSTRFGLHLTPRFSSVKDESGKIVGDYEL